MIVQWSMIVVTCVAIVWGTRNVRWLLLCELQLTEFSAGQRVEHRVQLMHLYIRCGQIEQRDPVQSVRWNQWYLHRDVWLPETLRLLCDLYKRLNEGGRRSLIHRCDRCHWVSQSVSTAHVRLHAVHLCRIKNSKLSFVIFLINSGNANLPQRSEVPNNLACPKRRRLLCVSVNILHTCRRCP